MVLTFLLFPLLSKIEITFNINGLPIESRQPTSVTNVACREHDWPPCRIHAYTVYTPIGGKGRCHTRHDLQDHSMQARKSAGKISTLDLKPMRKDTQSPKQEQSVAPQNGPWSRQKNFLKKTKTCTFLPEDQFFSVKYSSMECLAFLYQALTIHSLIKFVNLEKKHLIRTCDCRPYTAVRSLKQFNFLPRKVSSNRR